MSAERLLRKMAAEPTQTEKGLQRVIFRTLGIRFLLGAAAYGFWKWIVFHWNPEFGPLKWLVDDLCVAGLIYFTLRPLFVVLRMGDDEMDRIISEEN